MKRDDITRLLVEKIMGAKTVDEILDVLRPLDGHSWEVIVTSLRCAHAIGCDEESSSRDPKE